MGGERGRGENILYPALLYIKKCFRYYVNEDKLIAFVMLKVLILADQPNWIVNKVVDQLVKGIPCKFTKKFYATIPPEEFLKISSDYDLIYYSNWDLTWQLSVIDNITTPLLLGVRSSRWKDAIPDIQKIIERNNFYVQVINRDLLNDFPNARVIHNGIFNQFKPKKEFVVGFSGVPDEYKGFHLIEQACEELGVKFMPAKGNLNHKQMPNYYRKINLLVSASLDEGHCNPVHECMAMNIPVITTDTSAVKNYNLVKIERSVESIKEGILKFYTQPQVAHLTWENICKEFFDYFYDILIKEKEKGNPNVEKGVEELVKERDELKKKYFENIS